MSKARLDLPLPLGPGDDGQFSEREIEIDPFQVVLPRAANLDATAWRVRRRSEALVLSAVVEPTGDYPIARRFANFALAK